jgi:NADPH-dependent 2,4-dienoyl-CoA reductase/sulfur reductase-like enzyme
VHGRLGVEAIEVVDAGGRVTKIEVRCLAVSGGWNPAVHLTCHLGGKPVWNEIAAFTPGARRPACMWRGRRMVR